MCELWKPIPSLPGFEASTHGRIRQGAHIIIPSKKGGRTGNNYHSVEGRYVHHLVLEAFVGLRVGALECRHMDNCRTNNRLENIRWGTRAENMADKVRHGTSNRGMRCGTSKLTDEQVIEIWTRYHSQGFGTHGRGGRHAKNGGLTHSALAMEYGVSRGLITVILQGKRWGHLTSTLDK